MTYAPHPVSGRIWSVPSRFEVPKQPTAPLAPEERRHARRARHGHDATITSMWLVGPIIRWLTPDG
jgi:hypothetical protein